MINTGATTLQLAAEMPGVSAGGHGHHGQGKHASDSESILRAASGATSHQTKPVLEEHPFDEEDFQEMLTETFKEFANEDEDLVVSGGLL